MRTRNITSLWNEFERGLEYTLLGQPAPRKEVFSKRSLFERRRQRARHRVNRTLSSQPCEVCGDRNSPHGHHHEGYLRALDVIWLCPKHQKLIHTSNDRIKKDLLLEIYKKSTPGENKNVTTRIETKA